MELSTTYMGLKLRSPLVASPGPIQHTLDGVKALADTGIGAITLFSLFEEQVRSVEERRVALATAMDDMTTEAATYFPSVPVPADTDGSGAVEAYLRHVEKAATAVDIPVIASLNGATLGGWTRFARRMEAAGAAGLELNIYAIPSDAALTSLEVENLHIDIIGAVRAAVSIPVAVKLSPYFSSFGNVAPRIVAAGADALVLFNRFFQPDIDLKTLSLTPEVSLSQPIDGRVARTWIATLRHRLSCSLEASSGVETGDDIVKYLLAGADVIGTTSALLRHGPEYAGTLLGQMESWLSLHDFTSVDEARGLLALPADEPTFATSFEREHYFQALDKANGGYASLAGL